MHRRPRLLLVGLVAVLALAGCAPDAKPTPEPTRTTAASPTPTPTPTEEPIVAPDAAFDVTCADVAAVVEGLGLPAVGAQEVLALTSSPSWYPGPAQHMMQRVGGVACSAGDQEAHDPDIMPQESWEVFLVPGAQAIVDGVTARFEDAPWTEEAWCDEGRCVAMLRDGDVLLSAALTSPSLTAGDTDRVRGALVELLGPASATARSVEPASSEILGIACDDLLTAQELGEQLGKHVESVDHSQLGGWGVPAEVYYVRSGAQYCMYAEGQDVYNDETFLTINTLPAGAWAFQGLADGTPVPVDGADEASFRTDYYGRSALDVRVGSDWIRFTMFDGGTAETLAPIASMAVEHLERGRSASQ
ncbi:hypothetical protein [Microbacterium sp. CH1]|uniref:hypothetical protein n=1 Tax=Microbacterium sp. CH1 TaxID=1770208 RepID=UPI00078718F4|nr:hypothetical protein [Microbacterium sp. CH1]KYK00187.1 hypothetical protein AUV07_05535 [Microbacterium sp. CH1]